MTQTKPMSEQRLLRAFLEHSPDYIFFKDRQSRFVLTNDAHARLLLGLNSAQEATGKTDFDLFKREEAKRFYDEEQKIMETGQPVIAREWSLTSSTSGQVVWLSEHKLPIRDETGQVIGLLGISRDVTQLKQSEAERERLLADLKKAYADVERQVEERTAQLKQEVTERIRAQEENARLQEEIIEAQRQALMELSTPIIPLMERIIVMPLIGSIDTLRAKDVTRALLAGIRQHRARVVILDITGVPVVDTGIANHLHKTIQAARLKGAHTIITGMSDAVAEAVVDLGIDWQGVETLADLQTGLRAALAKIGHRIE